MAHFSQLEFAAILYIRSRRANGRDAADLQRNDLLTTTIAICRAGEQDGGLRTLEWRTVGGFRSRLIDLETPMNLTFFLRPRMPAADRELLRQAAQKGVFTRGEKVRVIGGEGD